MDKEVVMNEIDWEDETEWMQPANPDCLKNYRVVIDQQMETSSGVAYTGTVYDAEDESQAFHFENDGRGGSDLWDKFTNTSMFRQFEADAKAAYEGTHITFEQMDVAALWITSRDA